jgi:ketosteroid isomerase-like protein
VQRTGHNLVVPSANLDLVRSIYEDMNRRNWAAILAAMDESVLLVVHESVGPDAGTFRGRQAVGGWFGNWFLAFDKDYRFEVEEARSVDDRVFVVARHHGHGRSSGADVEQVNAQVLTLHEGKVVEMHLYGSRAEALKAAGLKE